MLDNYVDYNFCEAALSGYYSRTIVDKKQNTIKSPASILAELRAKGLGINKLDNCFRGLHRFKQDLIAHVDSGKPINAYSGKYLSDFIVLDIDHSDGAHLAVPLIKELLETLDVKGLKVTEPERYSYATTGLKGFVFLIHAGAIGFEPEVNFADISRKFCELLLPKKVGKGQGFLVDASNFESARLYRVIGSFNAPKNPDEAEKTKDRTRGYKVELIWNDILDLIKNPEHVYELWKAPNDRGIDDQTILGNRYWKCEPVPFLQSLWQQAKETYKEEKVQVQGTSFTPSKISTRHPACVAKLLDVIQNGDPDNLLAGHRHQAFLGLSTYAAHGMGLSASPRAHAAFVTEIHNRLPAVKQLPEHELKEIIRDGLKFSFSCGNADSGTSLMKFCGSQCTKQMLDPKRRWRNLKELLPGVEEFFQGVRTPFLFGIKKIDDYIGGFMKKTMNWVVSDPGTGKSLLMLQSWVNMAKIAKEHDFTSIYLSPEESLTGLASNLAMQLEKRTFGEIIAQYPDLGVKTFREFCEHYDPYAKLGDIRALTTKEIKKTILDAQQASGKKINVVYLDNITYLGIVKANLSGGVGYAQQVAVEINEMMDELDAVLFGSIHMPKAAVERKTRKAFKDGGEYTEAKPKADSAFGSLFFWAYASCQLGLYNRGDFLMLSMSKCRKRINGDRYLIKPVPLYMSSHYAAYELSKIYELGLDKFPRLNLAEMEALDSGVDPLEDSDEKPRRKKADDKRNVLEFANE